ncbi:MAG TPA: hypothetical protein VH482_31610 [Thermomicrobiales bacterium]
MIRNCEICGKAFSPDRHWHRQCWSCWHDRHGQPDDRYDAGFRQGFAAGEAKGYAIGFGDGALCERADMASTALDPDLLGGAIALAHPDRHPPERQRQANAITARLIELRDRMRGAGG